MLHIQLNAGRESDLDAMGRSNLGEVPVCSTIDIGDGDDVGASGEGLKDGSGGGGAGGEGKGIFCVLESCDGLLEVIAGESQHASRSY